METKQRFIEYIIKEPDRFLPYPFKENPNIKTLPDFIEAFKDSFPKQKDNITSDELIELFETPECKKRIKDNLTDEEFENIYGDGNKVIFTTEKNKIIRTEIPKIKSAGYGGVSAYSRTKPRRFTSVETKFLQVRKQKKIRTKEIISDYLKKFAESPRTESSISSKVYRI
jgi:hypothetical protein